MAVDPDLRYVVLDALQAIGVEQAITVTNHALNAIRQHPDAVLRWLGYEKCDTDCSEHYDGKHWSVV